MLRCKRCLLPGAAPGADLGQDGICNFCRTYKPVNRAASESLRKAREADLENRLGDGGARGGGARFFLHQNPADDRLGALIRAACARGKRP